MLAFDFNKSIMPQQFLKPSDATSGSRESLHRMILQRQRQEQTARLRLPPPPSSASLHQRTAPSLGLGNFPSLGTSLPYPSFLPSAADITRQHLIQSVLAANEQQQLLEQQRRLAIQEHLALQQQQQQQQQQQHHQQQQQQQRAHLDIYTQTVVPYPQDVHVLTTRTEEQARLDVSSSSSTAAAALPYPQDAPPSNIQVRGEDISSKKRAFDEMDESGNTAAETEPSSGPVSVASQQDLKEPPETSSCSQKPKSKPSPKKKKYTPRKYTKSDDAFLNQEPKKDFKWLQMLDELKDYKAKHGNCIVPRGYAPNPRLASWVAEQRKQYKLMCDGKPTSITDDRVNKLKELDFAWNAQEAAWARHMNDLKEFKNEQGHCHVPLSHTTFPKLGLWVKEQRRHYTLMQQGKPSHMTQARANELNSIDFCWDTHEATWLERLRQLNDYKDQYGDCLVPTHWAVNPKLGTWVNHQRRQYKKFLEGKSSHITQERIAALEEIGFSWQNREKSSTDADSATVASASSATDLDSDSERLPPRKRHRLLM